MALTALLIKGFFLSSLKNRTELDDDLKVTLISKKSLKTMLAGGADLHINYQLLRMWMESLFFQKQDVVMWLPCMVKVELDNVKPF